MDNPRFPAPGDPTRIQALAAQPQTKRPESGEAVKLRSAISTGPERDHPLPPRNCPACGAVMGMGYFAGKNTPIYRHLSECEELKTLEKSQAAARRRELAERMRLQRSNLPPDVKGTGDLQSYLSRFGTGPGMAEGIELCQAFLDGCGPDRKTPLDGFTLSGAIGSGKSTLILAFARSLLAAGVEVRWESSPCLYNGLLAARAEGTFEDQMRMLTRVRVLIIDDLGCEKPSAWWVDQVLGPIVDTRYFAGRPLILTTNYGWDELEELYASARSAGGETARAYKRMISRMEERSAVITFGVDGSLRRPDWTFMNGRQS